MFMCSLNIALCPVRHILSWCYLSILPCTLLVQLVRNLNLSRQQECQEHNWFNKQHNKFACSLHFLLHNYVITARLGSERFLYIILLYSIEQHIN